MGLDYGKDRRVQLSGFLGISHVVGEHAITGRIYSTGRIGMGNGPTETSCSMGRNSIVRVAFKRGIAGCRILGMARCTAGRDTSSVCGRLWGKLCQEFARTSESRGGYSRQRPYGREGREQGGFSTGGGVPRKRIKTSQESCKVKQIGH